MSARKLHIGICGTFDLENYGDLIYPLVAEAELQRRLGPLTLDRFSYSHRTPPDWPYPVSSLTELPAAAGTLDGIIIGGGHLVRFDKEIAPGYPPPTAIIHHPTGFWLTPALIALQSNCPVCWNAIGVHGEIPPWAEPLVQFVITMSSYVAVRDKLSRQILSRVAPMAEIDVVPDTAFGLAQLLDLDRPSAEYSRLRESLGLTCRYIVVQATQGLEAFCRLVRGHPQVFENYQLVVLPVSPVLGDTPASLGDHLPHSVNVSAWPDPLRVAELIAHADAVVGISLHLAITSLVFGVPVFRPAETFEGKYAILLEFDSVFPFQSMAEIDPQWFAARVGRAGISPATLDAIHRLSEHWDHIASAFSVPRSPATLERFGGFWQSLPGWLEMWAVRSADSLAERDALTAERDRIYNSISWTITKPLRALARLIRWPGTWRIKNDRRDAH